MITGETMGKVERPNDKREEQYWEDRKGLRKDLSYDGPPSWKYLWLMLFKYI
jgi:hypothetical protein